VPISDDVPLTSFTYELYHSLRSIRSTLRLTSEYVRSILGKSIMDLNNEYRLTTWLAQQEDQYKIALYQCDYSFSSWTQRCIRQADCILLVTLGNKQPTLGKVSLYVKFFLDFTMIIILIVRLVLTVNKSYSFIIINIFKLCL